MKYNQLWKRFNENKAYINESIILTPNNRLSQFLLKDFNNYNIQAKAWIGLKIIPFKEYIKSIWQDSADIGIIRGSLFLLSEFQKQIIFEQIIDNNFTDYLNLLNKKISSKVISAYNLLKDYDLNLSLLDNYNYPEIESLKILINQYNEYINKSTRYIDHYDFIIYLMHQDINKIKHIIKEKNIYLIGFDELSPLVKKFLNLLKSYDYNIEIIKFDSNQAIDIKKIKNYKFADANLELEGILDYSLELVNKNQNITIITPNLTAVRNNIIKKFNDNISNRQLWNISGGDFLVEIPVINSLVIILDFIFNKKIAVELAQEILRRPYYFNEDKEYINKAKVILNLRLFNYSNDITISDFLNYIKDLAPDFYQAVNNTSNFINNIKDKNYIYYPSEYSKIFMDIVNSLGWPGTIRNISSEEYQAIQSFQKALYEINKLDIILNKIGITEYFTILKNLLNNTEFQIEVSHPKINVLGILEGAGLEFDNLWFMSLNSELWPEEPSPNVFLPNDLQKKYNMPHSSFEREYEFASKITQRIFNNSNNIITSYYEFDKQKQLYPSSFIENIENLIYVKTTNKKEIKEPKNFFNELYNNQSIESYSDYNAPKISRKFIKSAIYALNLQIQCPFKAYAETRLKARKFPEIKFGITPIDRGNLLHNVMEKIWLKLKSKSELLLLLEKKESEINLFIFEIINSSFDKLNLENNLYNDLCNIEKKRLYKIIIKWLHKETKRNHFEVKYTELERNVKFENIYFTLRVDRIDSEYINGIEHKLIIDYKISNQNTNNWLNDITDVQMPLYYLMLENNNHGLLYSVINSKEQKFQGFVDKSFDFNQQIKAIDFSAYKPLWINQIKVIANQYLNGEAAKRPLNIDTTCKNCHLKSLCRLYE
tara:strand:- start:9818 stop:12466 length:2649 start_codon:yes stop_codon:yes gene_type:complete